MGVYKGYPDCNSPEEYTDVRLEEAITDLERRLNVKYSNPSEELIRIINKKIEIEVEKKTSEYKNCQKFKDRILYLFITFVTLTSLYLLNVLNGGVK